jgi:TolB-like protein/Tfp pilus assembly protein PilF
MPSLIPEFEYDVFISYRHKDNKGDHWVTEFIQALTVELESTFKEDISVYVDNNDRDGLGESHNVNKSIHNKLRCAVFIPIISQTYCDPKSFAWQNEFCEFNQSSNKSSVGRDVRLSNGNVASRILPVRIHDLDHDDLQLLEKELGSPLRPIDFIYKEAGVNRPLRPGDNKNENLCKTDYRNQINKVAIAIKEIINAIKNPSVATRKNTTAEPRVQSRKAGYVRMAAAAGFIILLLATSYYFYPTIIAKDSDAEIGKSLAVLPFDNLSNDHDEYLSAGLTDQLITNLSHIQGLRVASRTSVLSYKTKEANSREISEALGVNYLLEGSVQKSGSKLRISVRLIRTIDNFQEWGEIYDRTFEDILAIQDDISQSVATSLGQVLDLSKLRADKPSNVDAYDHFLRGEFLWRKAESKSIRSSIQEFKETIRLDPQFALAYSRIGFSYELLTCPWGDTDSRTIYDSAQYYNDAALKLNPSSVDALTSKAVAVWWFDKNHKEAESLLKAAIEKEDDKNFSLAVSQYGFFLTSLGRVDESISMSTRAYALDSTFIANIFFLGDAYLIDRDYAMAEKYYRIGLAKFPENNDFLERLGWLYCATNRFDEARQLLASNKSRFTKRDPRPWIYLAIAYFKQGDVMNSEAIIKKLNQWAYKDNIKLFDLNYGLAKYYSISGDKTTTYNYLEKSIQANDNDLLWLKVDPLFAAWRSDSSFQELVKKAGFR